VTTLEAILLGVIQGVFMFFPVSSTSHLVLAQHLLLERGADLPAPDSAEMILFDLVVHMGTLVSMAVVFHAPIRHYLVDLLGALRALAGPRAEVWAKVRASTERTTPAPPPAAASRRPGAGPGGPPGGIRARLAARMSEREWLALRLSALGLLAVGVTGLVGFPLKGAFEAVFARPGFIAATLTITGILLWWTDVLPRRKRSLRQVGPTAAVMVGLGQALALLPGLSRSGTTIAFGLFAGMKRRWAAEFSFFIAFPAIMGASLLQFLEVVRTDSGGMIGAWAMTVGFLTAAVVGVFALRIVLHLLYRARFRFFSFYVWGLAILVLVGVAQGWWPGVVAH
jgi:undecaprenyl-diphosphatase